MIRLCATSAGNVTEGNIRLRANTCPFDSQVHLLSSAQESVTIEWTGSETTYRLEYGPVGFNPGTGTVMNVTGTSTTINGLSANTEYDLYLSLVCAEDNVSLPVLSQFATLSGPISSFPWSCDFEGVGAEGWEFAGSGSTDHWTIGYSAYNSYISDRARPVPTVSLERQLWELRL